MWPFRKASAYVVADCKNAGPVIKADRPFGSVTKCSKCGGQDFIRRYEPRHFTVYSTFRFDIYDEHIRAECQSCGATFKELPMDASPKSDYARALDGLRDGVTGSPR